MPHSSALQMKIHPAYFWSSYFVYDVLDGKIVIHFRTHFNVPPESILCYSYAREIFLCFLYLGRGIYYKIYYFVD